MFSEYWFAIDSITTGPVVFMFVGEVDPRCRFPVIVIALDDSEDAVAPMLVVPPSPVNTPVLPPLIEMPPLVETTLAAMKYAPQPPPFPVMFMEPDEVLTVVEL